MKPRISHEVMQSLEAGLLMSTEDEIRRYCDFILPGATLMKRVTLPQLDLINYYEQKNFEVLEDMIDAHREQYLRTIEALHEPIKTCQDGRFQLVWNEGGLPVESWFVQMTNQLSFSYDTWYGEDRLPVAAGPFLWQGTPQQIGEFLGRNLYGPTGAKPDWLLVK